MSIEDSAADWFARMRGPDAGALRDAFAAWHADPDNAAAYAHLVRTWDQAKFLANTPTGRTRDLARAGSGGRHLRLAFALCASVLLALALGIMMIDWRPLSAPAAPAIASAVSSRGAMRVISLPDGSRVTLDRASRIDIQFGSAERRLRLIAGRARFDVAHDAARPFLVEAGSGRVIAHGTIFDVAVAPRGVEVVLLRGAIEVRGGGAAGSLARVRHLLPGQKVALVDDALGIPTAAAAIDTAWTEPMIEFDAMPLDAAVAAFNRGGGRTIRLDGLGPRRMLVTGAFRRDDPEGFAATLAATFGLAVRPDKGAGLALVPGAPAPALKKHE